jgi:hypothetical protein
MNEIADRDDGLDCRFGGPDGRRKVDGG